MSSLFLIDLSGIFWASWFSTAGQDIDAGFRVTYDTVRRLNSGYDATVVCCDVGASWRSKEYPQYKANRPKREEAAYDQLRRVREQLEADGLPVIGVEGYEADDVIATLACKAPGAGYEVVIASNDKDLLQLVGPSVKVLRPKEGLCGPDEVRKLYDVHPHQMTDYLALVGDSSDNVKGAPGVGPKHAARLLAELGSVANMYESPDGITPQGIREAMVNNRAQVELARRLVTLSLDVPIDFAEAIKPRAPKGQEEASEDAPADEDERPKSEPPPPPQQIKALPGLLDAKPVKPAEALATVPIVLDKQDPRWMLGLEPRNVQQLQWFVKELHGSQLYRKFPNAQAIMAVILRGRSMGISMMDSLDSFHVIEGKPALAAMAVIGVVLGSGKAEYFDLVETSATGATWETQRIGRPKPVRLTFTIEDAQRAGLVRPNGNWVKYPGPMCRKQAGVELARAVYPDVVVGVYQEDELRAS